MTPDVPIHEISESGGQSNQLRFILDVAARRWKLIFLATAIGVVSVSVWAYLFRTPERRTQYEAYTDVVVRESPWERPFLQGLGGAAIVKTTPKEVKQRISMRNLAEDAAQALVQHAVESGEPWSGVSTDNDLESRTDHILRTGGLELKEQEDQRTLRVVARASESDTAENLAEYAARIIVDESSQYRMEEEQGTLELIRQQLEELRGELDRVENREWNFRLEMGFRTKSELSGDMERINGELAQAKAQKAEIVRRLKELEGELMLNSQRFPESLGNVTDNVVENLLSELDALLSKKLTMSTVFTDEYPPLQDLTEEIAEKRRAVLEAVDRLGRGAGGTAVWERRQQLYRQRLNLSSQLTSLQIQTATLERMLTEMVEDLPQLADKNFEYMRIVHERDQVRERFRKLLDKEWEIRNALKRDTGGIERHNAVIVAPFTRGLPPKQWVNVVLGGFLGLLVGFGFAIMLEALDTSIRSIEDVGRYLGLEVIGTIPKMRFGSVKRTGKRRAAYVVATDESQIDACIVTQHDPKSPISEAYRTFRTNFQFATIQDKPKTVMVTSSVPGEGKTTTAVNMAVTMADSGMRVLIVDTDLRRPNVHRVLKMERGPGLADVLRNGVDLKSVIRTTRIENLWMISSGRVPPNPSELIGSDGMRNVIGRLGHQFDIVICDAPSTLVVTDPVLLATHVESLVLVVSVNNVRRETAQRAIQLLETAKVEIAGVLLNGLETSRRHYYYYYYYYDDDSSEVRQHRRWINTA